LNKDNNSGKKSEPTSKRAKSRGPMRRDTKEVLAELVGKLKEKLDPKKVAATSAGEEHPRGELRPNLDRLTVFGRAWPKTRPAAVVALGTSRRARPFPWGFLMPTSDRSDFQR
jgi:hypothetical protein